VAKDSDYGDTMLRHWVIGSDYYPVTQFHIPEEYDPDLVFASLFVS
jgi:hypothetical protein